MAIFKCSQEKFGNLITSRVRRIATRTGRRAFMQIESGSHIHIISLEDNGATNDE